MSKAPGFLARAAAVLVGIVLGMAVVASPWRVLLKKAGPAPATPIQRERAPDQRV